jgi:hypothetical protein
MGDFKFGDLFNAVFHLLLAGIYLILLVRSRKAKDLLADHVSLKMTPIARSAALFSGITALICGGFLTVVWVYSLTPAAPPLPKSSWSVAIRMTLELMAGISVFIAGLAVIGGWTHAIGLYVLSTAILLTTSFIPLLDESHHVHALSIETLSLSSAIVMLLAAGISLALQYFSLLTIKSANKKVAKTIGVTR